MSDAGHTRTRERKVGVADPWWDADAPAEPAAEFTMIPLGEEPSSDRWFDFVTRLPAVETLPLYGAWRVVVRGWQAAITIPSLRRILTASGATLLVALLLGASVGVIVLNNVVLERTGELNKLEQERRELRTENAQMAARIARLSAPPRIIFLAQKNLKMQPATTAIGYIYMSPQRAAAAARHRARQARERRQAMRPVPPGIPSNMFNILRETPLVGTEPYDGSFV